MRFKSFSVSLTILLLTALVLPLMAIVIAKPLEPHPDWEHWPAGTLWGAKLSLETAFADVYFGAKTGAEHVYLLPPAPVPPWIKLSLVQNGTDYAEITRTADSSYTWYVMFQSSAAQTGLTISAELENATHWFVPQDHSVILENQAQGIGPFNLRVENGSIDLSAWAPKYATLYVDNAVNVTISPSYQENLPGGELVYTVTVKNTGRYDDNYTLENSDSENWGLTLENTLLEVPADENRQTTLTVSVDSSGMNEIVVIANGAYASDSGNATAKGLALRDVAVSISPSENSALPGDNVTFTVTVKNTGNVDDIYDLTASDNENWGPTLDDNVLEVPAGENRQTTLSVIIPENAVPCTVDNIVVTATSQENVEVTDSASCIAHAAQVGPIPRGPIYIYGNDNFIPANGVTSGSGTEIDPYIIENWDISAGSANGIEIWNTTAYFIIRNCYVHDGGSYGAGIISFYNVTNGILDNVLVENSYYQGILLMWSSNNTISNSTVENTQEQCGIFLYDSDNNLIDNNTCMNNHDPGIYLRTYSNNNIISNNIAENNEHGIELWENSNNNTISGNICSNNLYVGIELYQSSNNLISNNLVENNGGNGIELYDDADNNTISGNICSNNYYDGITLAYSSNNTVSSNIAENSQNSQGIHLHSSDNNTISGNICSNNNEYGIHLDNSNNNFIFNNTCENNNNWDGIFLYSSSNNTLTNNACNNNTGDGIVLGSSSNNTLTNNACNNNTGDGIVLGSSSNNTLTNNACNNNWSGIDLWDSSDNNTLTNNAFSNNNNCGIHLDSSSNNTLNNNTCENNEFGIFLGSSDNNTLTNNSCDNNLYDGIQLGGSNNTLTNNTCSNNYYQGIALGGSNNTLANNTFSNNNNCGIQLGGSNNTLTSNTCENNGFGIYISSSDNNTLTNNSCNNNLYDGIRIENSSNNTLTNNSCDNNGDGIALGIYIGPSDNNTISGNICSNNLHNGIVLYQSSNNLIDNNLVENNYYQGIRIERSPNNRISNNLVENTRSECGIFIWDSDNNLIENNTTKNNNISGIYLDYSNNNLIKNNIAENNRLGIELYNYSDNNTISGNICSNNLHNGINLYEDSDNNTIFGNICSNNLYDGIILSSNNNLISNNIVKNNGWDGIELDYSDNNLIENNTCSNNSDSGIHLYYSDNNIVSNNTAEINGYAGIQLNFSNNNRIYHNNLIKNANQAFDQGTNYWDNGYPSGGNYWSDYTGADSYSGENQDIPGSDGIGDTPYYIPGDSNRDRYPLMKLLMTPDYIYLTWATPDTAHTINVSWRTSGNYVGEVRYDDEPRGGDPGAYSYSAEGTGGLTTPELTGYIHHVELTGLEADTIYYFICGNSSYGWSDEHSFRTAPDQRTSFRFATGGDSRDDNRWDYHDYWPSARDDVSREMAERNPSFVLFLGDYLWSSEDPGPGYAENDTWDNWLGAAFRYWRTDDNRLIPQIPVIGNHEIVYPEPSNYDPETDATNYYTVFNLPGNERWYALSWGPDLRIIVLDSEVLWESTDAWQEQLEWLESELENSENYLWKVAAFHRPIVSSGGWNWHGRLEDWGYLFTKYGVDVVFQAHIHWYDRLYPIDSDPPPGEVAPLGEGVVYLVSGGWGGPLSSGSPREYTAYGPESIYHFTLVDVFENGTFHSQAIDRYGTVFDEFFIYRDVDVSILPAEKSGPTGATLNYEVTVKNSGNVTDNYELQVRDDAGWGPMLDDNVLEVPAGENMQTILSVIIPENAMPCTEDNITVIATSQADNTISDSASCIAHVIGLASHDPILIKGNDNFIPANGVVGGSGMENDPYIIENWDISAENAHGIEIRNTSAHFVIRNCYVYDGGENYNGIYLYLVENGKIENNTCSNNKHGIHLESSPNNTVRNNTCSNNREYGIRLSLSSNSNTVRNNTCSNNREYGIYLGHSFNNTLENNTCENNWIGIYLSFSYNNTLEKNTCEGNTTHGIYMEGSSYDNLINNACLNNHHGIYLSNSSNNNTLVNNICENNTTYGIYIASSSYNNLINNACLNNQYIIYSGSSGDNIGSAHDIDKIPNGWPTDAQNTTGPQPPAGYEKGALSQTLDYQVVISDVPAYLWYNGCGPTAAGMNIGYWDEHGFDDLVSGSTQEQTTAVNDMISSSGNYDDYCVPIDYYPYLLPDKSEPPVGDEHANNCVADFMKTSQSYFGNYYGWSWFSDVDDALRRYVQMVAPHYKVTVFNARWGTFTWDSFCDEIDENHPVNLLVDTNGDGFTDHFVTAIGYGEQEGTPMYACLNTWDNLIHWYEFARMSSGQPWGIYGATLFSLEKNPISNGCGICLFSSNNNIVSNNTTSNNFFGIYLDNSFNNTLTNNTCGNNRYGIRLLYSSNNRTYHNNFVNNDNQACDNGVNYWDNGYPSGGNYWSDYVGVDNHRGENQDIPGSDGIGDTPYYIPGDNNRDRYPLMNPYPPYLPAGVIVRAKETAKNIDQAGPPPWLEYEVGDRPVNMVAKRVGAGGVFAAGASSTCRNARWNDTNNPGGFEDLLDVAFQWMVPGATNVLWYEGHNVYNTVMQCSDLVAELEILGYSVTPNSTQPITSTLLEPYDIFIIPQMEEGVPGTGGDPTKITDAEVTAIRNFVEGGGGFVIMEASDFGGYNYNKVQNKILAGLDFDYYFQDDQISDDTNNWGNAVYQIIADVDTTTEIGSCYQAATGTTTVGLYSTCSMAEAGPGVNLFVLPDYQVGMPGDTLEYTITVSNPENPLAENLTYNLTVEENAGWSLSIDPISLFVPIGGSEEATLSVTIPANTPLSNEDTIVVTAVASGYPEVKDNFICIAHAGKRIEPTDDTYVFTQDNDANYNDENALRIGRYYEYWQWPYLKFDLSEIPSDANITDVRLHLYAYFKYAGGFDVLCHEVEDDDWMEFGITWNNKPTYGAILDTKFVDAASPDSPKSYSWDVTSFVVSEFEGDQWASFCLRPPDNLPESISRAFWSKERYENRVRPFLRISYTTEVVERGVSVSISPSSMSGSPGDDVTFTVTVRNEGILDDSYSLTVTDTAGWSPSILPSTLTLDAGASGTATLAVTIPSDAAEGDSTTITVTATSQSDSTVSDSASCSCIAHVLGIPDIWVEPTEISITLPPDDTGERILKIGNDGDATLVYDISDIEISGIETSAVPIFSVNVQSSTETMGDIDTSSPKVAVPADTVEGTIDGGIGKNAYVPTVAQSTTRDGVIRLGVWWPRYDGDLPPYEDLTAEGIEASDVIDLNADTLPYYDVVYIGRGAFYVHTGEGDMDVEAVKDWVSNGGAIIGESESVIYDSVPTLGVDWSPQLSYVCGVWSTEANAWDYVAGDIAVTLNPEHPISNGLPETFSTTVYSIEDAAYLDLGRNSTAEEVGTVESSRPGIPPIIASNYGQGRAVYFPYCPDGYTDWSSVGGQYLEQLFINAVKWAAPDCPWLDENPKSGSVEPDSYDEITVTIDTTGLDLGDYSANIIINNNDPDEDPKVVPVYLTVTVVPREWDASITATFSGGSDDAIFGVRPDATSGFDNAYDIPEPPPPAAPPYVRTFFYYPEQTPDELYRSCLAPENLMEWPLRVEYAEGSEDITLTWDVGDIPVDYSVFLYRGENLVADMRAEESYTFEASTGSYDFRIVVGKLLPFTLELTQGWNMISFPVLPENSSPDSIFGSYYVLYGWDAENKRYVLHADSGSFIEPDPDVEAGVGYWAYVLEDENVNLLGAPVNQLTLSLRQGWNLMGPPYSGSSIADPADNPDDSVLPYAFTWNPREKSYSMTQLLEAGKGYWAYAFRDCTLELPKRLKPALFAFYYPWYGTPDVSGYWFHWNEANHNPNNFIDGRRDIAAKHYPLLGVYDSKNVSLIKEHIDIARRADIDAFVVSWWGINSFEDDALSLMKDVCEESDFKFTIYYETTSSLDSTLNDMLYLLDNYADSRSWYRIDDRPVIFIYGRARDQLNPPGMYWTIGGEAAFWALSEDVRRPPRYGIFVIHPYWDNVGFVQSDGINLPSNETYTLKVGISNMRNDCPPHSDVGFRIKIENETEGWVTLDNLVVNFDDGWLDLTYDISSYAGQTVLIRVESYAGGAEKWCSEWAAVDYFYIVNSKGEIINQYPYFDSGWRSVVEDLNESGYNPYFVIDFGGYEAKVQDFAEYYLNFTDGMHTYAIMSDISEIYSKASEAAHSKNKIFVATVMPGYDDTEVRFPGYIVERENGAYYTSFWSTAISSSPDHYIITSFNEWHEGTEIEPSLEYGYEYIDLTANYMENART